MPKAPPHDSPDRAPEECAEPAEILCEYGPFPGVENVAGVSYDGTEVWLAGGGRLHALDPTSGRCTRSLAVAGDAGTAFDGRLLYQIVGASIHTIAPSTGQVLARLALPADVQPSGLAWAEGFLWLGSYRDRAIHQLDPATGAVLRTIRSSRFVTGVTWVDGELWHGTWEAEQSDIRRIDPDSGRVLARLDMPAGTGVSGLESDGGDVLYAGGGRSGKLRAVRRPRGHKAR
jgi:hypothetical protein